MSLSDVVEFEMDERNARAITTRVGKSLGLMVNSKFGPFRLFERFTLLAGRRFGHAL